METLTDLFAFLCGQNPGHTWAPGGVLLPCCQRCTGLYVSAGLTLLCYLGCRPSLSGRFLYLHGGFLLLMVPFGFHWVPQGPVVRTISGFLFGIGITTFLWLPLATRFNSIGSPSPARHRSLAIYFGALLTALLGLLVAAQFGGTASAQVLSLSIAAGAFSIAALILANGLLVLFYFAGPAAANRGGARRSRRFAPPPRS